MRNIHKGRCRRTRTYFELLHLPRKTHQTLIPLKIQTTGATENVSFSCLLLSGMLALCLDYTDLNRTKIRLRYFSWKLQSRRRSSINIFFIKGSILGSLRILLLFRHRRSWCSSGKSQKKPDRGRNSWCWRWWTQSIVSAVPIEISIITVFINKVCIHVSVHLLREEFGLEFDHLVFLTI